MTTGFWSDYRSTFRGPYGWTMWYATAWGLVLLVALVWCALGLDQAQTARDAVLHATGVLVAVVWLALIKIWAWMQLLRVWLERSGGPPPAA